MVVVIGRADVGVGRLVHLPRQLTLHQALVAVVLRCRRVGVAEGGAQLRDVVPVAWKSITSDRDKAINLFCWFNTFNFY